MYTPDGNIQNFCSIAGKILVCDHDLFITSLLDAKTLALWEISLCVQYVYGEDTGV